jgi:hypothetical protein
MMLDFLKSDAFAAIICIIFGLICIWSMFKFFTKDSFLHSDTFSEVRELTPLPPIFNYYLIKILHVLGIIILIGCGTFSLIKIFLNF